MSPHFAAAVDPIFLKVLSLKERAERNEVPSPEWERQSLEKFFQEAESHLSDGTGWPLAKYALASWIDDLMISTEWSGRDWWESNSLEFAFFRTRDRATQFYLKAKEAAEMSRRDALEVFYLCVVMGFRGLYLLDDSAFIAGQLNLPTSLDSWAKNTSGAIQTRQGRPPIRETLQSPSGAPPLENRYLMVGAAAVCVILSILLVTLWWIDGILETYPS